MKKSTAKTSLPSCGCNRSCQCQSPLRCRRYDLNALLALALWDYSRLLRRHRAR